MVFISIPQTCLHPNQKPFQPLALLSSCGGIGGERVVEGGAQAAGLAKIAVAASVDIGDAGALRPVQYQIGADKTVGAAGGVERGARSPKVKRTLTSLRSRLPSMARDESISEPSR